MYLLKIDDTIQLDGVIILFKKHIYTKLTRVVLYSRFILYKKQNWRCILYNINDIFDMQKFRSLRPCRMRHQESLRRLEFRRRQ